MPPATDVNRARIAAESRSGLDPWVRADLPVPPNPSGLAWIGVVGPGVIVLGGSIGSGEFLLGPAAFVRYGLSLLWVTSVAVFLQTIFNTEVMRYTLATGEPAFTGFMRTRPSSTAWAWLYSILYFLQVGWPAWAGTAAGAVFFLFARRLAGPADAASIQMIGVITFVACVALLSIGRRVERTLELLNWVLVVAILGSFVVLSIAFVPAPTWGAAAAGLVGFDTARSEFNFLPRGVDFVLLGALVGYSGSGGVVNITLSNWARDKGYGMGGRAGYIPAAVGGKKVHLAHTGFMFEPGTEADDRWRGWWRIVRVDQWGIFFVGALVGMVLPALLYVTFLPHGSNIEGLGISAALASAVGATAGPLVAGAIAFLGVWILFKTQLDLVEGMARAITDILWTGSRSVRAWRGGDVRAVYYAVLGVIVVWGIIAMRLAAPMVLLKIGGNVAGVVFVVASLHLLYVNTRILPVHVRPPLWRRASLVAMALFYGVFVALSLQTMWAG
jgi:hypothetical protein